MDRRSFVKGASLLGLAAAPAVVAAETPAPDRPVPNSDVFGRRGNVRISLPPPEEGIRRWYTDDREITHCFDLQIAFHQLAEAEMRKLPAHLDLDPAFIRRAVLSNPGARVRRATTPKYVFDIYDNSPRPTPSAVTGAFNIPLAGSVPNVYAAGDNIPARILVTARRAVEDLVTHQLREIPNAAFTCPFPVIKFEAGYLLEFFFYSQRLYQVEVPAQMPATRTHTTIYPERP